MWGATIDGVQIADYIIISIHAPRVGSDDIWEISVTAFEFQSTLPVWGATIGNQIPVYISQISIHAPRVGSDLF